MSVDAVIPSTKASPLERELFITELVAALAERLAEVGKRLEALDRRVAKLGAKQRRKAADK